MTTHPDWNAMPLDALWERLIDSRWLATLIDQALAEDGVILGDVTSTVFVPADARWTGAVRSRAAGRVAGVKVAAEVAKRVDQLLCVEFVKHDGDPVAPGDTVLRITGPHCSVLTAERTMLNVLTHLSGIATLTGQFVDAVAGTAAKIYDTRKTIPGYRALAKYAVRCGGGYNHRIGLHDAVLIKDNHLAGMPGDSLQARLHAALAEIKKQSTRPAFIELEVDTLDQLDAALTVPGIDIVLLDNMPPDQLRAAVARRDQRQLNLILEASGGIDLTTVRAIAETGIDRIAIGAITHSAPTLDLGLDET